VEPSGSEGVLPVSTISKVTIDEIGIAGQDGANAQPHRGALNPPSTYLFNQAIQVNWFTAACLFMKQHRMRGIYYWGPWLSTSDRAMLTTPSHSKPSDIQPLAQRAIRCLILLVFQLPKIRLMQS